MQLPERSGSQVNQANVSGRPAYSCVLKWECHVGYPFGVQSPRLCCRRFTFYATMVCFNTAPRPRIELNGTAALAFHHLFLLWTSIFAVSTFVAASCMCIERCQLPWARPNGHDVYAVAGAIAYKRCRFSYCQSTYFMSLRMWQGNEARECTAAASCTSTGSCLELYRPCKQAASSCTSTRHCLYQIIGLLRTAGRIWVRPVLAL